MKSEKQIDFEEVYINYIKEHSTQFRDTGLKIILEEELNRADLTQDFYKVYERYDNLIMLKHGYKIAEVEAIEEDLASFCFSLLQFEAVFPLKIMFLSYEEEKIKKESAPKIAWAETQILVPNMTHSESEIRFETKIYYFFTDILVKEVQKFVKQYMKWKYMITEEYSDEKVILKFQEEVIAKLNKQYKNIFENQNVQF